MDSAEYCHDAPVVQPGLRRKIAMRLLAKLKTRVQIPTGAQFYKIERKIKLILKKREIDVRLNVPFWSKDRKTQ
jgi:hypothetical protein